MIPEALTSKVVENKYDNSKHINIPKNHPKNGLYKKGIMVKILLETEYQQIITKLEIAKGRR